jgi:hypothetical protein
MTDYYIDSNRGDNADDGSTPALAKKTLAFIDLNANKLLAAGDNIYLACDGSWNHTEDMGTDAVVQFRGRGTAASPITITSYVPSGADSALTPLVSNYIDIASGDWSDAGSGLWTYTTAVNIINVGGSPYILVLYGTEDVFAEAGTTVTGGFSMSGTTLTINSGASNPTTTYERVRVGYIPVFHNLSDSFNTRDGRVFEGIECKYASMLSMYQCTTSTLNPTDNKVNNCTITKCGTGVYAKAAPSASSTLKVDTYNNEISEISLAGVYLDGENVKNSTVDYNNVSYCNQSNGSNGGITVNGFNGAGSAQNNIIEFNNVSNCPHGRGDTNTFDGSGIYVESGASENIVRDNSVSYCHVAIQDNSGEQNEHSYNAVDYCDLMLTVSDAEARGNIDLTIRNNTAKNATYDQLEYDSATTSQLTAIIAIKPTGTYNVVENILTGADGTTGDGVMYDTAAGSTVTFERNCFDVNGGDVVNDARTPQSISGTNLVDTDPVFATGTELATSSPCRTIGVKHWGEAPRPSGASGEPFPDLDIDIGANQSLFSSDHPANL